VALEALPTLGARDSPVFFGISFSGVGGPLKAPCSAPLKRRSVSCLLYWSPTFRAAMCDPYEDPIKRPEMQPSVGFITPTINLLKARNPTWIAPVATEFLPFLGYIAIAWSFFEDAIERFLGALQEANHSTERWRGLSFDNKKKVFKTEIDRHFKCHPWIAIHFHEILKYAITLQKKRNLILHGHITLKLYTKWIEGEPTAKPVIVATSQKRGNVISEEFDVDSLENLYYELAHLGGLINRFAHPIRWDQFLHFSLQDISFLQEFLRVHYRPLPPFHHLPTNPKSGSPPQSSAG
jgi:hypothetical protein